MEMHQGFGFGGNLVIGAGQAHTVAFNPERNGNRI
jgi:hypothetical protein